VGKNWENRRGTITSSSEHGAAKSKNRPFTKMGKVEERVSGGDGEKRGDLEKKNRGSGILTPHRCDLRYGAK